MPRIELARLLATWALVACFFLPLSECSIPRTPNASGEPSSAETSVLVLAEIGFPDVLIWTLPFGWPLVTSAVRMHPSWQSRQRMLALAELSLSLTSLLFLAYVLELWERIRFGGVIAVASLLLLTALSMRALIKSFSAAPSSARES